eukprot:m.375293 g.375293  ORF g.375293 m.375293 type:complete len:681 (-) comp56177_c0_seq13:29-2071(-)
MGFQQENRNPLLLAAFEGRSRILEFFLTQRPALNSRDQVGRTALLLALTKRQTRCAELMLEAGVDTSIPDVDRRTALMYAAEQGNAHVTRRLLEAKVNVNQIDKDRSTALMLAADLGHVSCAKLLIKAGTDLQAVDKEGQTALKLAAESKRSSCCKVLLDHGAAVLLTDSGPKDLVDFASRTSVGLFMQLTGSRRLQRIGDAHGPWETAVALSAEQIVKSLSRPDGSFALQVQSWFNCLEINGRVAVPLDDHEFWELLGRQFCEARLIGSLSIRSLTCEGLKVLRKHIKRTWASFSLTFLDYFSPDERCEVWDDAFVWMTELLQHDSLVALDLLRANDSPILTSTVMPAFYDSLQTALALKSLLWGGVVHFSPDQLPDLVTALRANMSIQDLSFSTGIVKHDLGKFEPVLREARERNKALPGLNLAVATDESEGRPLDFCPQKLAKRLVFTKFRIEPSFFNKKGDLCYCELCFRKRGDKSVYLRGEPPSKYALPGGFVRLGLHQNPGFLKINRVMESWHVAYHGTRAENLEQIFKGGMQLLKAGDIMLGGRPLGIPPGHIRRTFKRQNLHTGKEEEFNPHQIFTSPSHRYSAHPAYAHRMVVDDPDNPGQQLFLRFMFQVRQRPGSYGIGQETVGAERQGKQLDERFKNSELEFYTEENVSLCLTGGLLTLLRSSQVPCT